MSPPSQWFCTLLDAASDVFFRYELAPAHRLAYISPSAEALTGVAATTLQADVSLCRAIVAPGERGVLVRMLRARRRSSWRLHLVREGVLVPVEIETVPIVNTRRIVAIEGRLRLALASRPSSPPASSQPAGSQPFPVQQRLTALMLEVHNLLHLVMPTQTATATPPSRVLRLGDLALDCDRLVVTENGAPVDLTSREVRVLRYLLERRERVVTRQQLLSEVWGYQYDGDDRTVDVHISRLRRKLPSLRGRIVAIRQVGYRIDDGGVGDKKAS